MKVAIMQPYIFPYIGYFQLINYVDKWVIFDDTQYISKGWINRNRMVHPDVKKEWQYFTVPVKKHSRESKINHIEINNNVDWRGEFLRKLEGAYKKKAPYYRETISFVEECIDFRASSLSEWIEHTLKFTCDYLDIAFDYLVFSKMNIGLKEVDHAGQWALEIADAMGAAEYVNPAGGYTIFNESEFQSRNIKLRFLKPQLNPYVQRRGYFVPGLSIVDVLMWNDKEYIVSILDDYDVFSYQELIG
ncbi:MAG: WbqC family protein [Candidatus Electrothrix sp. GW3-4]|uniref:WbqC family protein n=1 Tax=Candidatus Electrothrix sp. GW3-4 TaxID=3126740 RepID=UPI0030CDE345